MSESKYSVTLGQIIKEFDLEVLCAAPNYEQVPLHTVDVNRPGLPLSGFFEHFDTKRLLLMGLTETAFVAGMTTEQRRDHHPGAGGLSRVSGGRPGPWTDGAAHQGPDLCLYERPHRQPL